MGPGALVRGPLEEEETNDAPTPGEDGDVRDDVGCFGPIGVEGVDEEEVEAEAMEALEAAPPNGPEAGTGGSGPPLILEGNVPREAASGSREAWVAAAAPLALDAALAGRICGKDGNGEGAEESTAEGVMNIERVPSKRPPKSGSAFDLGTAGGGDTGGLPFASRCVEVIGLEGNDDDEGPAPGDWGGSDGGPFINLLGRAGAGDGVGCGGRIVACGAADAGRAGSEAGLRSSSSFGMYAGRGGPVGAGMNFLSAFLMSGLSDSSSRNRCLS